MREKQLDGWVVLRIAAVECDVAVGADKRGRGCLSAKREGLTRRFDLDEAIAMGRIAAGTRGHQRNHIKGSLAIVGNLHLGAQLNTAAGYARIDINDSGRDASAHLCAHAAIRITRKQLEGAARDADGIEGLA